MKAFYVPSNISNDYIYIVPNDNYYDLYNTSKIDQRSRIYIL